MTAESSTIIRVECKCSLQLINLSQRLCKSWVAFLQGFLSINLSGRAIWGYFSFCDAQPDFKR